MLAQCSFLVMRWEFHYCCSSSLSCDHFKTDKSRCSPLKFLSFDIVSIHCLFFSYSKSVVLTVVWFYHKVVLAPFLLSDYLRLKSATATAYFPWEIQSSCLDDQFLLSAEVVKLLSTNHDLLLTQHLIFSNSWIWVIGYSLHIVHLSSQSNHRAFDFGFSSPR